MKTGIDLDEFLPTMDAPDKVYQLFESLGFKVLDSHLKTNPSVYNLPVKEAAIVEKIYAVSNYDRRFQILLFKLKAEGPEQSRREAIRTIPEKILREVDFPFIVFTPDFKTYTFTLVEKVREGPGEFKRKLTKLIVDSSQPYHTDKEILGSLALSVDIKNPVEVYKLFQSAFSVEKVTKKFFTEYREVFEQLVKEVIKQNTHLKFTLFARDGSVENFVKILLGRLMFLYFIQKRGWLNCFDGWGSGDKKFLYHKFEEAKKEKKNYFKDYLEPLFFDTLNNPRRDKPDQATQFGGRIPFLNGGLFEPEYEYKEIVNHIFIENQTFDMVFSVFEKYNFTVKEDEPLEKEVAIDPEMLGKVFENLLEENLRKGKGTYYTPREIVHYMCHESLINYLASEVNLDQDVIRNFLDREQSLEKKETLSFAIREKAKEIDEKLSDIKVLDPACGSGAFLVGMLHEVINARLSLNRELGRSLSEYELKKATIQNNIYGVDIDPGATEIAKLRLWLTLVVDHNLSEIEPLPNLDYKIMVGNSLLDEFMGVKLFDLEKSKGLSKIKRMKNLFEEELQLDLLEDQGKKIAILEQLHNLHGIYFKEFDPNKKKLIRDQIDRIEFNLIEATVKDELAKLEAQSKRIADIYLNAGIGILAKEAERISKLSSQQAQILETFNEIKKSNVKPFFLFQLHFSDVFEKKGGFDIVIANPPYGLINKRQNKSLGHKVISETLDALKKKAIYKPALGGMINIFRFFVTLSLYLLKENGHSSLIFPMAFMCDLSASNLRKFILENYEIEYLEAFPERDDENKRVFESVKMSVCILGVGKSHGLSKDFPLRIHQDRYVDESNEKVLLSASIVKDYDPLNYTIPLVNTEELKIIDKVRAKSLRLEDMGKCYTGEIDLTLDKKYLTKDKSKSRLIKGAQVQKYELLDKMSQGEIMYLKEDAYVNSTNSDRSKHNQMQRIVMQGITGINEKNRLKMTIIGPGIYCANSVNYIFIKDSKFNIKFLLGILDSKLENWFYKTMSTNSNVNGYEVDNLPILVCEEKAQNKIINLVDKILEFKKSTLGKKQTSEYEQKIDQLVYKLYGLTPEEIKMVEGNND